MLISVIVPCYNQAQYLDECLESILKQTYKNWECIIVNDGSPDNTEAVSLRWVKKDPRFKYIKKNNGGLSSARNAGICEARGEWVLPLDADDKISNDYLALAEKEFDKDYTIIYSNAKLFGIVERDWELEEYSLKNIAVRNMIFCSSFFKKKNWQKVGGYDDNLLAGWEDWEFWISILRDSSKVLKINNVCFFYRIKEISMVKELENNEKKRIESLRYIYKKHSDFFIDQLDPYIDLYSDRQELEKIYKSKRYKIGDFIIRFIKRIKL